MPAKKNRAQATPALPTKTWHWRPKKKRKIEKERKKKFNVNFGGKKGDQLWEWGRGRGERGGGGKGFKSDDVDSQVAFIGDETDTKIVVSHEDDPATPLKVRRRITGNQTMHNPTGETSPERPTRQRLQLKTQRGSDAMSNLDVSGKQIPNVW